jgi:membrane protein
MSAPEPSKLVVVRQISSAFGRFFAMRGTHLAAMVAYFALASFVPLVFLALATLGLFGRVDESTALVSYLEDVLPGRSVDQIVRAVATVQDNARTLGIVGAIALLWSSLSLFSALESAFNIVYERPNRSFLRGKALAASYMTVWLVAMLAGLGIGTLGTDLLSRYAPDVIGNDWIAVGLTTLVSAIVLLVFLGSAYYRLTNAAIRRRDALPGAAVAAVAIDVTLQGLPLFLRLSSGLVALQALGTTFLLLVWLYVMANMIVFGSVLNWQLSHGRTGAPVLPRHDETPPVSESAPPSSVEAGSAPATPPPP